MKMHSFIPLIFLCAGIGLSTAEIIPAMAGFGLFAFGTIIGLAMALLTYFGLLPGDHTYPKAFYILTLLPLLFAVPILIHDLSHPLINDVSTDSKNPPEFVAARNVPSNVKRDMTYPEKNKAIVRNRYIEIRPLVVEQFPEETFKRAYELAGSQSGWEITHSDSEQGVIEGEVTTFFFHFVDDFIIRISTVDGHTRVDMRSKSRDGLIDAGADAQRIETFLKELAQ